MDFQTGFIYVGVLVISAGVILLVSWLGTKEKSYDEVIAEQRKFPDDLLLTKRDKGKEKKHKSKTGKKVKEKKEEKDEKDEKIDHVQFEETPQILTPEVNVQEINKGNKKKNKPEKVKPILVNKDESPAIVPESIASQPSLAEVNHFDVIHPKDDLELIRSQSKENIHQIGDVVNKSPKESPVKKRSVTKESTKRKDEIKDEKKDSIAKEMPVIQPPLKDQPVQAKESQKEAPKDMAVSKESKKSKKKNDILAQIGGDRDGVNVSLLMPLVQKAELSRSEIQILIDQLLNKQLDNPMEHSEWTEGRADPVIKLKKQLAEKDKALAEEHEASATFQNKLKELRAELNSERSRLSANVKQLEEALNTKITEVQTLHTRMQHILESHAAEKQGFSRQIEQLQAKVNEDAAIIHKMQEDQGQTQGHLQQELIAQRKQLEVQFNQMRENENALKSQLAQKLIEIQELQNVNISVSQELQAACDANVNDNGMLHQQLRILQEQFMHSEAQLQHYKEAGDRLQDMARQLEESHRAHADLDHRLGSALRHEQELQKQIHSLQAELKIVKTEASEATARNGELNKVQTELIKVKSDLSMSQSEAKSEAAELLNLRGLLSSKDEEINKIQLELTQASGDLVKAQNELTNVRSELTKAQEELKHARNELKSVNETLLKVQEELARKTEQEKMNHSKHSVNADQMEIMKLQEENDRLAAQLGKNSELQKEFNRLCDENKSLLSQLAAINERNAAEARENGVTGEKMEKTSVQVVENLNLLTEKDIQLDALRSELTKKQMEFNQLHAEIENLKHDASNHSTVTKRLQEDLEAQRSKNNENLDKIQQTVQESIRSLLQRIFPDIKIVEKSHDKWLNAFEEQIHGLLIENKINETQNVNLEVEKENKNLQGMVAHYKQIIVDTEGMLNNLQNHVESAETRWKLELRQKENEIMNLRLELMEQQKKSTVHDSLENKISHLETRLKEEEAMREQSKAETVQKATHTSPVKEVQFNFKGMTQLLEITQLIEDNKRLTEDLQTERNKSKTLDDEMKILRTIVENSKDTLNQEKNLVSQLKNELTRLKNDDCGVKNSSDQCAVNGPQTSNSSKPEQTRATQSMLAAIEKIPIKNAESENTQQEINNDSLISEISSNNCHTTAHDTQASCNPMNGQQHKKHKKKRKVKKH